MCNDYLFLWAQNFMVEKLDVIKHKSSKYAECMQSAERWKSRYAVSIICDILVQISYIASWRG